MGVWAPCGGGGSFCTASGPAKHKKTPPPNLNAIARLRLGLLSVHTRAFTAPLKLEMIPAADPAKREHMRATMRAHGGPASREGWAVLWREGLFMWDLGKPTPALLAEVAAAGFPPTARALIPGCGAAYDARALAPTFSSITAMDICEEAISRAREECAGVANVHLLAADFFSAAAPLPFPTFDFIFDYTFFCAISPAQRGAWGERTSALLAPGGRLLTLAFPLASDEAAADPAAAGPPHPVSVSQYRAALEPHGLRIVDGPRRHPLSVREGEAVIWWERAAAAATP